MIKPAVDNPRFLLFAFAFVVSILAASSSFAQQTVSSDPQVLLSQQSTVPIPLLNNPINIDGNIDPNEWLGAQVVELNFISRPFEDLPPPVKTTAKVFENGSELFVLFEAFDPKPDEIRAFLRDRDDSFGNDLVGVKIDTFNDGRLAYQYFANPLGVQNDSIENEMTGDESDSWNGIWESAGRLTSTGYVVEMKIPLRLMNFEDPQGVKTWGIEFVRFYPRSDSYRLSHVPFDRDNACNLCQMGEAEGFSTAKQANNLAIVPTLVLGKSETRNPVAMTQWESQSNTEVGLDINWGITPELSLTGTLNPDFSQVEADVAQLNINNTFALFFDELRPFFVENAEYFSSVQELIYTRNINSPDYGAKVTGRVDSHSIGFFVANDETTNFLVPGNLGSSVAQINEKSTNIAGRYRYDYSDDFSVGMLTTARHSDSYQNVVASVDIRYRITQQDTIRAQLSHSDTEYPEFLQSQFCGNNCDVAQELNEASLRTAKADGFAGQSLRVEYNHETEDYYLIARHTDTDADFRADLGFISSVDTSKSVFGGGYNWWQENSWWNRIRVNADWDITHNDNGELIEKEWEAYSSIRGIYQSFAQIGVAKRDRVGLRNDRSNLAIDGNTTRFEELSHSAYFETTPNQILSYSIFGRVGDRIDIANNRLGDQTFIEQEIELNLGKHFQFELEYQRSRLEVDNAPLFDAHLYDLRSSYQFDPRQFLRLIISYSDIDRNQANYQFDVDENRRNMGMQLLYSYKLNPLTKFFVGYSQGAVDNDQLNELKVDNRSVFMKFSYAWLPAI